MRNNQPVYDREYVLPVDAMLVSSTDLKGIINHCNPDFIAASGYSEEELIGAPHNLVRHPDMPEAAFADLWTTLHAGKPWSGIVKNRRKDGGFYWVLANATPIAEGGKVVGYMSVRTKPSSQQVAAAEALYASIRNGTCAYDLVEGGLVPKAWLARKGHDIRNIGLTGRITAALAMLTVVLVAMFTLLWMELNRLESGIVTAHAGMGIANRAMTLEHHAEIATRAQRVTWGRYLLEADTATAERNLQEFREYGKEVEKRFGELKDIVDPAQADMVSQVLTNYANLMEEYRRVAADSGKSVEARKSDARLIAAEERFDQKRSDLAQLMDKEGPVWLKSFESVEEVQLAKVKRHVMMGAIALIVGSLLLKLMLSAYVTRTLGRAREILVNITRGEFRNEIGPQGEHEIGRMLNAMRSLQTKIGFDVVDFRRLANENLGVRIALDNVSTGVMISDNERRITYMNNAVQNLLSSAEQDIRKVLPAFDSTRLLGMDIDVFHRNSMQHKGALANLNGTRRTEIELGGHVFGLAESPVINRAGARLGAALEWRDRTAEVAVEKEVAGIVEEAVSGNFTQRVDLAGKEGFFLTLSEDINRLMDTADRGLQEVVRMLEALARGDLTDRIVNEYSGTFDQLKNDANATAEKLGEIVGQIKSATETIATASSEISAGNSDLSRRTEEQAGQLEKTAARMTQLTGTVRQNTDNAKQANQLARGASEIAVRGGEVVGEVVTTMDQINEASRKIVDIISVIDGIAFQTNILALNAAVEAARAGEQGRGFAVVAGEVRNLAQRSASAAKEIKHLIDDSVVKVEGGSKLVAQAGHTMEEIVGSIQRVTDLMGEIASASVDQTGGIEQVNQALTQMDEVTQQNAALVEEAAAAAESLEEQAQNLAVAVATFKVDESAGSAIAVRRAPAPASHAALVRKSVPAKAPARVGAKAPLKAEGKPAEGEEE